MEGNVSGYVCNHGSPNGERDTSSPRLWAMLRTQASDEEADDVFSRQHLYCGTPVVTSWAVAGQQVVFLHMYLQIRVTLRAFPVATPRGRSVPFPIRGTMVTYVNWFPLFWETWRNILEHFSISCVCMWSPEKLWKLTHNIIKCVFPSLFLQLVFNMLFASFKCVQGLLFFLPYAHCLFFQGRK